MEACYFVGSIVSIILSQLIVIIKRNLNVVDDDVVVDSVDCEPKEWET